jgi:dnd system-associated protein 4
MAIARVAVAEDKAELVRKLKNTELSTGPFKTYADVVTFAAVLGFSISRRVPLLKYSRKEPDSIPQDQFRSPFIIELLAMADVQNPMILSNTEECDRRRTEIFQEYANGGLEVLKRDLEGITDYSEYLLLMLSNSQEIKSNNEFDLLDFI